eukprot:Nk52_evm17s2612 gene=Nk52_evmTU17s2612
MSPVLHLWLRHETKEGEHRAALTPEACRALIKEEGYKISVEKSTTRIFPDQEYAEAGCELTATGSWQTQAPKDVFIIGLKELPEGDVTPLQHRHIFFGHCYKGQEGWKDLLARFMSGGGQLYDMEFLNDPQTGRRVAAFGFMAGFCGAAIGLDDWCQQRLAPTQPLPTVEPFPNQDKLVQHLVQRMEMVRAADSGAFHMPRVHIIGALGRCGSGAVSLVQKCGIPEENIIKWDIQETKAGGPFPQILQSDILVNCIYLNQPTPHFITLDAIQNGKDVALSVVVDVSCDVTNPNNPLPFCNKATTFIKPTERLLEASSSASALPLDIVTIDHLPTMLPKESSERYVNDLLPCLRSLGGIARNEEPQDKEADGVKVWRNALDLFHRKCAESNN